MIFADRLVFKAHCLLRSKFSSVTSEGVLILSDFAFCLLFLPLLQEGKGGELTHDETTIISGALDLSEKVFISLQPVALLELSVLFFYFLIF